MSSIPELLAALPSVSWPTAFTIVAGLMTITFGVIQMIKALRQKFPKDVSGDVIDLRKDMKSMNDTISKLHTMVHSKKIRIDGLERQVDELKTINVGFQQKLEKVTDLIIKYLSDQR